jgi:hypothetical protein
MDSCKAALCGVAICLGAGHLYADTDSSDAGQVAVTFFTDPANASLYSPTGGLYGASPLTLYYQLPPTWDGCVQLEALQAVWVSGVDAEVHLTACPEHSRSQHYTFTRPDLAGADLDRWFAEKVEQLAMVEDPVSRSKHPAHAATVEPLSGNLVTCSDHGRGGGACR